MFDSQLALPCERIHIEFPSLTLDRHRPWGQVAHLPSARVARLTTTTWHTERAARVPHMRTEPFHHTSAVYLRIVEFSYTVGLSTREATVLIMAAGAGVSRKEAAYRLGCRPGTVDTYWQRILHKCGMDSQLGVFAALLAFSLRSLAAGGMEGGTMAADLARYRAGIDSVIGTGSESLGGRGARSRALPVPPRAVRDRLTSDVSRARREIARSLDS